MRPGATALDDTEALARPVTIRDLLTHLYVLMPVLDDAKHYYVGEDELAKLLARGDTVEEVAFDRDLSPFAAQAAAFQRAAAGERHDFSVERDLRLMRLFDRAYQEARACL